MELAAYYRENGESEFVGRLEGALDGEWRSRLELAERAGVSKQFAEKALPYLFEEGRAERTKVMSREYRPRGWRWEWRRPPAVRAVVESTREASAA